MVEYLSFAKTGQIDSSLPIVKNDTGLDDSLNSDEESIVNGQNVKCIFWQASINDKRPQLKVKLIIKLFLS